MKKATLFISVMIIFMLFPAYKAECISYENVIEDVLSYRGNVSEFAGSTDGDWCAFVYGRYYGDNSDYLHNLSENVYQRYQTEQKLSRSKSTEWHRIILTVLACGGDPFNVMGINLLEDGVYNRGNKVSLGKQGLNGWIWALISLDAAETVIPEGSYYSRKDIIIEILKQQNSDGGFSLYGETSDSDITANAVTALSRYFTDNFQYNYINQKTGKSETKSVKAALEEALLFLSEIQLSDGGFASGGVENCESSSQVLLALCSMGIDPISDGRYIKNGNTVIDNVLSFKNMDGGFSHVIGMPSNSYASDQAALGLIAADRFFKNDSSIFSFSIDNPNCLQTEPTNVPIISTNDLYIETGVNGYNGTDINYKLTSVFQTTTNNNNDNSIDYSCSIDQKATYEQQIITSYNSVNRSLLTYKITDRNIFSRRSDMNSAISTSEKTYETTIIMHGKNELKNNEEHKLTYIIITSAVIAGAGIYVAARRKIFIGRFK